MRSQSKGQDRTIIEKHTRIIERHTQEKITLQTEINRLTQQILILKETKAKEPTPQVTNSQNEKRKIYNKVLSQERQIENLRNKLESTQDDNHNLRLMLQNNEESKE